MENKRDRHFTEEEIKDKIVQSAEGMEVPDSLKPENIEKKLAQKKRTPVYGIIAAAACCCLVVGAVALSGRGMMQDKEAQKVAEKAVDDTGAESTAALASAKDYDLIYEYVQAADEGAAKCGTEMADGAALYSGEKAGADQAVSHSDTNVRTDGVGEGDTVKTDGKYLYIMSMDQVKILNIESEEMQEVSTISMDQTD